jgi:hypothetical protein
VVRRDGGRGAFYRAGEAVGRRGGDRQWWSFTPHRFQRSETGKRRRDNVDSVGGVKATCQRFGLALLA